MPSVDTADFCVRELPQPEVAPPQSRLPGGVRVPPQSRPPGQPRWLSVALVGCGVGMLPWLVVLAMSLPAATRAAHWSVAWVGLDALEALGLVTTGWLLRRADPRLCLAATATAVLLAVDAWFDVTTAAPGRDLAAAIAMAACAELPMATLCAVLARRSLPGRLVRRPRRPPSIPLDRPEES